MGDLLNCAVGEKLKPSPLLALSISKRAMLGSHLQYIDWLVTGCVMVTLSVLHTGPNQQANPNLQMHRQLLGFQSGWRQLAVMSFQWKAG